MKTDVFIYLYAVSRTKWKIGISKATLSAFLRLRKHYMSHLCNFKFSGSHTKKDTDEVNFNNCILPNVSKIVSLFLHAFFFLYCLPKSDVSTHSTFQFRLATFHVQEPLVASGGHPGQCRPRTTENIRITKRHLVNDSHLKRNVRNKSTY